MGPNKAEEKRTNASGKNCRRINVRVITSVLEWALSTIDLYDKFLLDEKIATPYDIRIHNLAKKFARDVQNRMKYAVVLDERDYDNQA